MLLIQSFKNPPQKPASKEKKKKVSNVNLHDENTGEELEESLAVSKQC